MAVALRTGTSPNEWLDDPRLLATAIDLLNESDEHARRSRGR